MTHYKFKNIVNKAVRNKAFNDLIILKNSHKKVKHIQYVNFEMQSYLKTCSLSNYEAKFAFHTRCRMLQVRNNYSQSYKEHFCPVCKKKECEDSQTHLLDCKEIVNENILTSKVPEYDHLFSKDLANQVTNVKILKLNYEKRKRILGEENKYKN